MGLLEFECAWIRMEDALSSSCCCVLWVPHVSALAAWRRDWFMTCDLGMFASMMFLGGVCLAFGALRRFVSDP